MQNEAAAQIIPAKPEVRFSREKCYDIFTEISPLLLDHYLEIAHYLDIPLDPDYEQYKRIEEAGALRTFTARTTDGELIGYAIFFVRHNLHYKSSLQAVQDIIYIDKKRRGFGMSFVDWCDAELRAEGVEVVYHHVKSAHNWGQMLEKLDYKLVDLLYTRRLN